MSDALHAIVHEAKPAEGRSPEECAVSAQAAIDQIEGFAADGTILHGTWVFKAHVSHLAEEIAFKLLVAGQPLYDGSIGAKLFEIEEEVKLLWSGIRTKLRTPWKKKLGAGEMSRGNDTKFAQIVESPDVNHLKACKFEGGFPALFWEAAAASFSTVASKKPLAILIGIDTLDILISKVLWKAEMPGVVRYPPAGNIDVVSVGRLPCAELMAALIIEIERLASVGRAIPLRWRARTANFTCRQASVDSPSRGDGDRWPLPLWSPKELLDIGYTAQELDRGSFTAKQLKAAGYTAKEIIAAGFTAKELFAEGYTADELKAAGYTADEIKDDYDFGFDLS